MRYRGCFSAFFNKNCGQYILTKEIICPTTDGRMSEYFYKSRIGNGIHIEVGLLLSRINMFTSINIGGLHGTI